MPSTHLSLHVHVIFSTKNREPFIADNWCERLHAFLGGATKTAECVPEAIGGTSDHVHLLIGIRATHRLADVIRDIKQASSRWVHQTIGLKCFGWQDGYGAFTAGASRFKMSIWSTSIGTESTMTRNMFGDSLAAPLQGAHQLIPGSVGFTHG
jgi:REP-associated tyrosine transposase